MGSRKSAFTLIELMLVVAIISLLAAVAAPSFLEARKKSQNARFVNDQRVIAGSFEQYAMEHGQYPPDDFPGVTPAGMATYFTKVNFSGKTPMGGNWDWDEGYLAVAALSTVGSTAELTQWQDVDRLIDDGNLSAGSFRQRPARFSYIIEN